MTERDANDIWTCPNCGHTTFGQRRVGFWQCLSCKREYAENLLARGKDISPCGCLDQLNSQTGYTATFERFTRIDLFSGDFVTMEWSARLFKFTKGGNVSKGHKWLMLNYCPICGNKLRRENGDKE